MNDITSPGWAFATLISPYVTGSLLVSPLLAFFFPLFLLLFHSSFFYSLPLSLPFSLSSLIIHSVFHYIAYYLPHSLCHSFTPSFIHSFTHFFSPLFIGSLTSSPSQIKLCTESRTVCCWVGSQSADSRMTGANSLSSTTAWILSDSVTLITFPADQPPHYSVLWGSVFSPVVWRETQWYSVV